MKFSYQKIFFFNLQFNIFLKNVIFVYTPDGFPFITKSDKKKLIEIFTRFIMTK